MQAANSTRSSEISDFPHPRKVMAAETPKEPALLSTGIAGMDDILRGGFPRDCIYLVSGTPGTGKTTLGLQFLLAGVQKRESCLYITLSETRREIEKVAQ